MYRPWTNEEKERLKKLAETMQCNQISETLGRPYESVRYMLRKLSLGTKASHVRSEDEIHKIGSWVKKIGVRKTAKKFGLTKDQVQGISSRYTKAQRKTVEQFPPLRAARIRSACINHAMQKNRSFEDAQDFGSWSVLKVILGSKQNIHQLYIDWQREYFADIRTKEGKIKARAMAFSMQINGTDSDYGAKGEESPSFTPADQGNSIKVFELLNTINLDGRDRVVFVLANYFGLSNKEISLCLNTSESFVSMILSKTTSRLREEINGEKSDPDLSIA